jgi:hypothetical protein
MSKEENIKNIFDGPTSNHTETASVLTDDDIRSAINLLRESDKEERIAREKRSLKDWSKMKPFYEAIRKSDLSTDAKISIEQTVDMLAQGYYLVIANPVHTNVVEKLRNLCVPEEVIANIYKSDYLPTS